MDIRKLQRAIVDGLEDVKAQNIAVFNTEHLTPLFERVIIATGTSNRQTKALASSVRESVKRRGLDVMRTEGEENGEWIIVDCGAAVVHLMQPAIRTYYHLEEIWGEKSVRMKLDSQAVGLVKASAPPAAARSRVADASPATRTARSSGQASHQASPNTAAKTRARAAPKPVRKARAPKSVRKATPAKTAAKKVAAKRRTARR